MNKLTPEYLRYRLNEIITSTFPFNSEESVLDALIEDILSDYKTVLTENNQYEEIRTIVMLMFLTGRHYPISLNSRKYLIGFSYDIPNSFVETTFKILNVESGKNIIDEIDKYITDNTTESGIKPIVKNIETL